jgi:hypothetical protein
MASSQIDQILMQVIYLVMKKCLYLKLFLKRSSTII